MDKVLKYKQIIREVLQEYAANDFLRTYHPDEPQIRLVMDTENNHYQVLYSGWVGAKPYFSVIFHFDIIEERIWLQRNVSDYDIVEDLELKGVPKSDIVLAFHAPEVRHLTGYGF